MVSETLTELRKKEQGDDHWQTVNAQWQVEAIRRVLRQTKEMQKDYAGSIALVREAEALHNKARYKEAQSLFEKALVIYRTALGEDHPYTATRYNWSAFNLNAQGKYAQAEEGYRKALAIRRKTLGEEHPLTAQSHDNLGLNRNALGKYAEAEEPLQKALAIRRKVLGEGHSLTATSRAFRKSSPVM
jgi:tetratricopeptide (TPR) repeat protein